DLELVAIAEAFNKYNQSVLPPTRLPEDMFPDCVPVMVIDTSSSLANKGKLSEELKILLHKLVFPTVKSVGNPVGKGPYPWISHRIIPMQKPSWVNIFPRNVDYFPRILPWIIRGFDFPHISHIF
ncbi:hypothetical protein Tco_1249439, partial [Tanacetum coccineum]